MSRAGRREGLGLENGPTLWDLLVNPVRLIMGLPPKRPVAPKRKGAGAEPKVKRAVPRKRRAKGRPTAGAVAAVRASAVDESPGPDGSVVIDLSRLPRQAAYERVVQHMLATHGIRVRKWRRDMSGVAWEVTYRDGAQQRLIESPRPKTPISMAIFLHEIGHHVIGLGVWKPRVLEELKAWEFAVNTMGELGLEVDARTRARMHRSMKYAAGKATRRGIRALPGEVVAYLESAGRETPARV